MEHFLLYILSRYFIWLHKWNSFNDICASLKSPSLNGIIIRLCTQVDLKWRRILAVAKTDAGLRKYTNPLIY